MGDANTSLPFFRIFIVCLKLMNHYYYYPPPFISTTLFVFSKVVNSPLLKTAIAGNDPNVGRLLAAVGKAMYRLG